jgi:hypothetical protein
MSTKTPYSFTVLRYVHDIATGEFLNVGVALLAPDCRYVNALCRPTFQRLKHVFPTLDGESFRASMRHVTHEFERLHQQLRDQLPLSEHSAGVMGYAHSVLGPDDSSLQWSPMGAGMTVDPERTLDQLFDRFVMAYDKQATPPRRQDDDVWRHFSHALQQRQVLKHFVPKTISVRDDQLEFEHAWKNGVWHCLAPVSFDLASSESIRDKAHRWLGQLTSVAQSSEAFKLYFLVGGPTAEDLQPAFESALSILGKAPVQREVFIEASAQELSERLAEEVQGHLQSSAAPTASGA